MRGHVVLSLKLLARNSCEVLENLCPAVIVSPVLHPVGNVNYITYDGYTGTMYWQSKANS